MITVRRGLMFARSHHRYAVLTHQTTYATMTNIKADLFKLLSHARPAITAQTEARLFFDMRQRDQIGPLSAADRATTEGPQATRTDAHDTTHPPNRKYEPVLFNELKPHGFWLAKNTVALFRISLSSLRIRFSRRSRSFS